MLLYAHLDKQEVCTYAQGIAQYLEPGDCLCLKGALGVGKSTFARALIRTLCPDIAHIPSPTFPIIVTYPYLEHGLWHCDFYRITHMHEIEELGVLEAMPQAITLIEWPEKMGIYLPKNRLEITLSIESDTHRTLHIAGYGTRAQEHITNLTSFNTTGKS